MHQRYWDLARRELGDGAGTRALIAVLLLTRAMPAAAGHAGIGAALACGRVDADLIAVEARRHLEHHTGHDAVLTASTAGLAAVVPIGAAIDEAPQPAPVLDGYNALLSAAGGAR